MNILANDGISNSGKIYLEQNGFNVITDTIPQDNLIDYINDNHIKVLLVRSATQVRKNIIDACCYSLKIIGRGGVGMDNIDVDYAIAKGIEVINTPSASSSSVAELVFAHLFSLVRFLHDSNRNMPLEGDVNFKGLKKRYTKGRELRRKTIGIIGAGRIGQEVAKIAVGLGMQVLIYDMFIDKVKFDFEFFNGQKIPFEFKTVPIEEVLKQSDFVTLHIPAQDKPVIGEQQLSMMKKGAGIINASRGGLLDEKALIDSIQTEHISYAGLDVFENEPKPEVNLLMNPNLSLTPHIGAATLEAQDRIGTELAEKIMEILK